MCAPIGSGTTATIIVAWPSCRARAALLCLQRGRLPVPTVCRRSDRHRTRRCLWSLHRPMVRQPVRDRHRAHGRALRGARQWPLHSRRGDPASLRNRPAQPAGSGDWPACPGHPTLSNTEAVAIGHRPRFRLGCQVNTITEQASLDTLSAEERSRRMRRVSSKNTGPEMRVRRLAHALGFRYRLHAPDLPGRPDLVFRGRTCTAVSGTGTRNAHGLGCRSRQNAGNSGARNSRRTSEGTHASSGSYELRDGMCS